MPTLPSHGPNLGVWLAAAAVGAFGFYRWKQGGVRASPTSAQRPANLDYPTATNVPGGRDGMGAAGRDVYPSGHQDGQNQSVGIPQKEFQRGTTPATGQAAAADALSRLSSLSGPAKGPAASARGALSIDI